MDQIRLTSYIQWFIFTTGPALITVCALQQSVGGLAAALMKTGSDMSYSMTSLLSHHAQAFFQLLTRWNKQTHTHTHTHTKCMSPRGHEASLITTWVLSAPSSHKDTIPPEIIGIGGNRCPHTHIHTCTSLYYSDVTNARSFMWRWNYTYYTHTLTFPNFFMCL